MPVKRSRMVQSSSAGDTGVVSADNRWKNRSDPSTPVGKTSDSDKPREPHDQTRTVLTLASPVREHIGVSGEEGGKIGNFLEKCYYCKKKIEEDSEVFMYR
ncbi:hypothetical protein Nepgr_004243 [Nepenthes gracilis]|uniref:FLZ-type domain-containing protein n=1 Tax=Nepenthes gracilis TaxID=150966 RepID=A0AAD3S118_NEPGR|nr:hypothetical protein Nepgr_004243 [Nepenthes gracilis]